MLADGKWPTDIGEQDALVDLDVGFKRGNKVVQDAGIVDQDVHRPKGVAHLGCCGLGSTNVYFIGALGSGSGSQVDRQGLVKNSRSRRSKCFAPVFLQTL